MAESELATVARPYARAAFGSAMGEEGGLAKWSRMLGLLAAVVSHERVREALDNPALSANDEAGIVIDILDDELTEGCRNFVHVLAEYGRVSLLPEIWAQYELQKAHHEKTMDVEVVSAFDITEEEKQRLIDSLKRKLQREINLEAKIEKRLLGGVIIRAEDTVIDNSVRGKLDKLSRALH